MARIKQFDLPPDLLSSQASGMSFPPIRLGDYCRIVEAVREKFGKSLKKMTAKLMNEIIDDLNELYADKMSIVARKSIFVTVIVTEVEGSDITFIFLFGDLLRAIPTIREEIFREVARRVRFHPDLKIKNGDLVGRLALSSPVYLFPKLAVTNDQHGWKNHVTNVDAEIAALRARRLFSS